VSDGTNTTSTSFTLTVQVPVNTAPTISAIANQTVGMNKVTAAIPFTVGDAESSAASLTVSAASSQHRPRAEREHYSGRQRREPHRESDTRGQPDWQCTGYHFSERRDEYHEREFHADSASVGEYSPTISGITTRS